MTTKFFSTKKNFNYYGLKKIYFKNRLIHSKSNINQELRKFASKERLKYLNREDFMCEVIKNECDYVDKEGNKLLYDYGHYTKYGAIFLVKKFMKVEKLKELIK